MAGWLWLAVIIVPIYYIVITSLREQQAYFAENPLSVPAEPTLDAYRLVLENESLRYFANSVIVTVVAVAVRNTGTRAGAEVVQLYLSDHVAQVAHPVRELIGYARVPLAPGQACRVTFTVHAERTSFTGLDYRRVVEPGEFTLALGRSSADLVLACELTVTGDTRVLDRERVMTTPVRTETVDEFREGERS